MGRIYGQKKYEQERLTQLWKGRSLGRYSLVLSLCLLLTLLTGCLSKDQPAGLVATVNGKPIVLRTLQAFEEADMADTEIFEQFSLHELRKNYGRALGSLIMYELILQDLERRKLPITQEMVTAYEKEIRSDYPDGEFEKYFQEHALDLDAWRETLRYSLGLQVFTDQVLRKNFVPSLEDVEAYYQKYKETFVLEESYDVYGVNVADKATLKGIKSLEDLLGRVGELDPSKMSLVKSEVPEAWQKHIFALKGTGCTEVFKEEEHFSLFCLEKFIPARELTAGEAYVYIEEFLAEEQLIDIFEKWLEEAVLAAKIEVSKHVIQNVY